jgi:hypothetical protein
LSEGSATAEELGAAFAEAEEPLVRRPPLPLPPLLLLPQQPPLPSLLMTATVTTTICRLRWSLVECALPSLCAAEGALYPEPADASAPMRCRRHPCGGRGQRGGACYSADLVLSPPPLLLLLLPLPPSALPLLLVQVLVMVLLQKLSPPPLALAARGTSKRKARGERRRARGARYAA